MAVHLLKTPRPTERMQRIRRVIFVEIVADRLEPTTGVLCNISRAGAAVIADSAAKPQDRIMVRLPPQLDVPATIVWRKGRRMGIQFNRPLSLSEYFDVHAAPLGRKAG